MPCVSSVCVCLVGGGGSHVCVHSHLYTICDLKGRTWQQRLQKCSEKYHTSTVHHLKDVTWLEWLQCILYQRMELLCHSSQTETLVHTWCDVLADDNWNCSSLHSKLVPVLFYSSSITSYVLLQWVPSLLILHLLPPCLSPLHLCPFSLTELLFIHHFSPILCRFLASVSEQNVNGVWKQCLGFTQCAWHKLIRVIRCSLTVVLPLK